MSRLVYNFLRKYEKKKISCILILLVATILLSSQIDNDNTGKYFSVSVLSYPKAVIAIETKFTEEVLGDKEMIDFDTKYVNDNELELGLEK